MLFKNAFIYRLTKPAPWTTSELEELLDEHAFAPCGANDSHRLGWIAPAPELSDCLTYSRGRHTLITLNKEEKILPASVVNDEVSKHVQVIEEREQRRIRKKERQDLKDQAIALLLPKAFTKSKPTSAWLDADDGWLVVDTPSATRADEFTATLRKAVGTLPLRFLKLKEAPAQHFSNWVKNDHYPAPLVSGDQCELRADDGTDTVIRCKGTESLTDAIASHLDSGMQVTQINLSWDEKISFLLTDELIIKRIKYLDTLQDKAAESDTDAAERFNANFYLLTSELSKMLADIVRVLGGENREASGN